MAPYFMACPCGCALFGSVEAVAGIAEAGNDVAVVVQIVVDGGGVDRDAGLGSLQPLDAFRRGQQADEADVPGAALLQFCDRGARRNWRWPASDRRR